ncbi:hypothetical protein Ddye_018809 [Dipteronia dyeriana]|uniref:Retrotransposon Copia-like N-terminal domain-containing protein n=1 Tax=Dipteronia dyeriana TaxID=168575 RepID=A0AAD9UBU7_9ROSI|nr:hypothetical protein Ddye_018809 [Dipteronia dyeriana]
MNSSQPCLSFFDQDHNTQESISSPQTPNLEQSQGSQEVAEAIEFLSLTKRLNYNLPIKLGRSNYIYWKAQVLSSVQALDLE